MSTARYFGLSDYFMSKYGHKCIKLSVDGGFSCPNRDGTLSTDGCAYCSERGSGEFAGVVRDGQKIESSSIVEQIESQKQLLSEKWNAKHFIAYFQNYTNTYKPIIELEALYSEALACEGVMGLAIATRPDCIETEHLDLFKKYKVMWVELGLQSIHDEKSMWMNRHYSYDHFLQAFEQLKAAGIDVVVHLIVGLPGERCDDFLSSVKHISALKPFGVKFHALNIIKGTSLASMYLEEPFELLTESEYIDWIGKAIQCLDPDIVIHRLTGDGEKASLIAPKWILNKRSVLNGINKSLAEKNIWQGMKIV